MINFTRHRETSLYCTYFFLLMLYSRNSSLKMLQLTSLSLVLVRTHAILGSIGLLSIVGLVVVVAFVYSVSDSARKRYPLKSSPRYKVIATVHPVTSSPIFVNKGCNSNFSIPSVFIFVVFCLAI